MNESINELDQDLLPRFDFERNMEITPLEGSAGPGRWLSLIHNKRTGSGLPLSVGVTIRLQCVPVISAMGRESQEDPWGSLARQPSQISAPKTSKEPWLKTRLMVSER